MVKQTINLGSGELTGDGESIRSAFSKINNNFDELYLLNSDNVVLSSINASLIPDTDVTYDLGSATNRFRDLYLSGSTIDLGGTTISAVGGQLQIDGTDIADIVASAGVSPFDQDVNTTDSPQFARVGLTLGEINVTQGSNFDVYVSQDGVASHNLRLDTNGDLTVPNYIKFKGNTFIGDEPGFGNPSFRIVAPLGYGATIETDSDIEGSSWTWTFGTDGTLGAPGNITAVNFIGDGSQLTGLPDGTAITNGTSTIDIPTANGSIVVAVNNVGSTEFTANGINTLNLNVVSNGTLSVGLGGSIALPSGYIKSDAVDGFLTIEGPLYADMVQEEGGSIRTITNGVKIRTHRAFDNDNHDWNFSWDGAIYAPRDASNYQVGAIEWRTGDIVSQVRRTEGGTLPSGRVVPPGQMIAAYGALLQNHGVSVLTGGDNYWTFEADGSLTLPESSTVRSAGSGGLTLGANFDVKIVADYTDNNRTWTFNGGDGSLTFPDSTNQTTALKTENIGQTGYRLFFDTDIYANSTGGATNPNETAVQFASNDIVRALFDLTPPATSTDARAYVDPLAVEFQPDPNILEVTVVSGAPIAVGMTVYAIINETPTFLGPIDSQVDATTFRIMGAPLTEEIPVGTLFEFYGPGNFIEYAPINPITISWDSGETTVVTAGSTNSPYGINVFLVTDENQTALTYPIEVATDNYAPAEFSHVIDVDNDFKITSVANDFVLNANNGPLVFRNSSAGDAVYDQTGSLSIPSNLYASGQVMVGPAGDLSPSIYTSVNAQNSIAMDLHIDAGTNGVITGNVTISGDTINFSNATVTNWKDPNVVNAPGGSAGLIIGLNTATMDALTVRITENTPGQIDVEFNYDAGVSAGISANGDNPNRFNGIQVFTAGNTTWTTMNVLTAVGDKGEMTIVDHSYHKIYRVTTFASDLPSSVVAGAAYCIIERLK